LRQSAGVMDPAILDFRMQILDLRAQNLGGRNACTSICNLNSETGNPPEGWESEGQILDHK